jgi:S1-C subfamily serine protease
MQFTRWQKRAPRAVVIPVVFALGAVAAIGLRGNAVQPSTPVQPPAQAISMQNSFEQVADKLRPSVVFIQSRQNVKSPVMFQFYGNVNERGDVSHCPRKSSLFFLTILISLESYCMEIGLEDW